MVDTDILVHPIRRSYKLLPLVVIRRCPLFMITLMSMSNKKKKIFLFRRRRRYFCDEVIFSIIIQTFCSQHLAHTLIIYTSYHSNIGEIKQSFGSQNLLDYLALQSFDFSLIYRVDVSIRLMNIDINKLN
jgi:hypothetical protein